MKLLKLFLPGKRADEALARLSEEGHSVSYWGNVKKQFRKNRVAVWSLRIIWLLVILAVLADFLANEKPLVCKYRGSVYFPVFREYLVDAGLSQWPKDLQNVEWKDLKYDWSLFPLIPYLPKNLDHQNEHSVSPFATQNIPSKHWKHWMGTDELGHDILAGMLHGTRIALTVGLVSMSVALFIGLLLGAMAGYFGDERLKMSRARMYMNSLFFVLALFYGFGSRSYALHDALADSFGSFCVQLLISFVIILFVQAAGNVFVPALKFIPFLRKKVSIPVDMIVSRLIEIMLSVPTLFLIISVSAILTKPSIFIVMIIIGLTGWTGIARFIRAELLRIRNLEYIEAANALGFSEFRILFRHAIPNALSPVLIAVAFGIASAILTESTLSFLGIGVPAETITWGSLLARARETPTAWWVAIFPGFAIFLTVTIFNLVGEGLTDALDPRLKK
jgi:peptide/nickel transport system permease protein